MHPQLRHLFQRTITPRERIDGAIATYKTALREKPYIGLAASFGGPRELLLEMLEKSPHEFTADQLAAVCELPDAQLPEMQDLDIESWNYGQKHEAYTCDMSRARALAKKELHEVRQAIRDKADGHWKTPAEQADDARKRSAFAKQQFRQDLKSFTLSAIAWTLGIAAGLYVLYTFLNAYRHR
jgi:hypothetical protein